jgi:hypothetical protein
LRTPHGKDGDFDIQYSRDPTVHVFNKWKEVPDNCMNNSNSSSNPTPSRATLKLKVGARKSARENKTPPPPQARSKANGKPGAHWSDEYKESMQADMDRLRR